MGDAVEPLDHAKDIGPWLEQASREGGVPAVVPCTVDGEPRLASGAWRWSDDEMNARATRGPDRERVAAMVIVCGMVYAAAVALGAEIDIR